MQNRIPADMMEVNAKLQWEQEIGLPATESSVINEAVLNTVQYFLDEAMDGHYWVANWEKTDHTKIKVIDTVGDFAGFVHPQKSDFESEFRANSTNLIYSINNQVAELVKNN